MTRSRPNDPPAPPPVREDPLLARPFDLAGRLREPPFRVDSIPFVDLGLIALLALLLSQRFLFSPGVPIDLPRFEDPEAIIGARAEAVATVWNQRIVTVLGAYPLERMDAAFANLSGNSPERPETLLLLVDRETPLAELGRIYESARRAGFDRIQLAARTPSAQPSDPPIPSLP